MKLGGKIARAVAFGVLAGGIVAGLAVGNNVYGTFSDSIKGQLIQNTYREIGPSSGEKESEVKVGKDLAEQVEEEGAVLLRNRNNALPLDKEDTIDDGIAILGYGAAQWYYGGSGSGRTVSQTGSAFSNMVDLEKAFENDEAPLGDAAKALLGFYRNYAKPVHDIDTLGQGIDGFNGGNTDTRGAAMFGLKDPAIDEGDYPDYLEDCAAEAKTALVVISRQGGESEDMPGTSQYVAKPTAKVDDTRHQLMVSENEEALLRYATENFDNVIVVLNSTNAFQCDFLERIPGIDACIAVGATGEVGANAIPRLIFGEANFSGHLADTYAYNFQDSLYFQYSGYDGVTFYDEAHLPYGNNQNTNAGISSRPSLPYIDYVEGIYVGYRYYETADHEGMFKNATLNGLDDEDKPVTRTGYDAVVQFPFGYGLSYTEFEWTLGQIRDRKSNEVYAEGAKLNADADLEIMVNVKNVGKVTGKEVVQLYLNAPYTAGGIEKSYVKLVDFEKTAVLAPGETNTITLHAKAKDFASFDCYDLNKNGITGYEIESGAYELRLQKDSHHLGAVKNAYGADTSAALGFHFDDNIHLDKDEHTGVKVDTLFTGEDAVDGVSLDGSNDEFAAEDIDYVSRKDFANLEAPLEAPHFGAKTTGRKMGDNTKDNILFAGSNSQDQTKANAWNAAEKDAFGNDINEDDFYSMNFGVDHGVNLGMNANDEYDDLVYTLGDPKNYDSDEWDNVLEQVTYAQATGLVNNAHPKPKALDSVGIAVGNNLDGPNQIGSFGADASNRGTGYPIATVLAQTFNKTLAYEWGLSMGQDMKTTTGVYGPAMNCHRSPFAGRNYEYYSEDPYLSGIMGGNACMGIRHIGKYAILKHFVAAETETSRDSLYTWMSEQALREIYLEPFRIAIEEYGVNALMTAYNRIGSKWCGGSEALMNGVLRGEWGFKGFVITDYSDNNQFMNMDEAIRAGGDLGMAVGLKFNYNSSPRAADTLKRAVKHYIYAYCNCKLAQREFAEHPYKGVTPVSTEIIPGYNWVDPAVLSLTIGLGVLAAGLVFFAISPFILEDKKLITRIALFVFLGAGVIGAGVPWIISLL